MNKFFTKVATLSIGLAMAIGVGVAVGEKDEKVVKATDVALTKSEGSGGTGTMTYKNTDYDGVKIGAGKSSGTAAFSVESGTTTCSFFAAGWAGKTVKLSVSTSVGTITPSTVTLTADSGVSGSGNSFTISGTDDSKFLHSFELSNVSTSSTISITTANDSGDYRAAIWNASYSSGSVTTYTVQYLPGTGASGTIPNSTGSSITLKTWSDISGVVTPPSGKCLSGWNTNADGSGTPYASGQTGVQADITLYAQWADPLTVAQARAKVDTGTGLTEQFVKGVVSSVPYSYSSTNKNITFNLSDDGKTSSNQFQAYKCHADSDPDVKVGDIITVYGTLTKYNSTYEFTQGNTIASHSKITGLTVSTAPTTTTYNSGDELDVGGLVVTATYDSEPSRLFSYTDYSSGFTFSPANGATLSGSDTTLTINYGHGSTTQALTINTAPAVLNVAVDPASKTLGFDEEFTITATVNAEGGASQNVNWSIEDSSTLVTIKSSTSSQAVIKANSSTKGTAVVTATSTFDGTKKASCTIKIVDPDDLTDTLTYELIGVTSGSYSAWNNVSDATAAVYAGTTAGGNTSIQINSGYGIRNTASAGYIRQVDVTFDTHTGSDRSIDLYGYDEAQESITTSGQSLGSATYNGTVAQVSIQVDAQYEYQYFVLSSTKAIYVSQVVITYEKISTDPSISIIGSTSLTGKEGAIDSTSTSIKVKNIDSPVFTFTYNEDEKTEQATSSYVSVSEGEPTDGVYPLTFNFVDAGSTVVNIDVSGQKASISVTVVEVSYINATLSAQYRQVFDISALQAGDQIIIADNNSDNTKDKYMNTTLTSGYFGATAATFTNSYLSNSSVESANILTLGGNDDDGWTLMNSSSKYLSADSSKNFVLSDSAATWAIEFSGGDAIITYSTSSYGYIMHNVSSPRFKPYTSNPSASMRYPQIYRYVSGEKEVEIGTDLLTAVGSSESAFTCNDQGTSFDADSFNSMASYFSDALINAYYLDVADSKDAKLGGNLVENFLARYDYVLAKREAGYEAYASADDFLGRISSGKVQSSGRIVFDNVIQGNSATLIIIVASIVSLTAVGGYFLFKKKKQY